MDIEAIFKEDLNNRRKKVNTFELIYRRLLKHRGVLGLTIVTNDKVLRSSWPEDEAETAVHTWSVVAKRLERDVKELDYSDDIVVLQVSTAKHELIFAFGQVDEDDRKRYGILVHQLCQEPAAPDQPKEKAEGRPSQLVEPPPSDPREEIFGFQPILDLRKKMWKDASEYPFKVDPQLNPENLPTEMALLEELKRTPADRGFRRHGKELQVLYHFLSRCEVGPADPKTGECKWSWLEKPAEMSFGAPNVYTLEMAKEFADTREEVENAAEDIGQFIEGEGVVEPEKRREMKERLERQKRRILMKKLEHLRKKRMDKRWKKVVAKKWSNQCD